jgi:hypothetical protein
MEEPVNELAAALAKAQGELGPVKKTKVARIAGRDGRPGREYHYADLADVLDVSRRALSKHGIAIVQGMRIIPGGESPGLVLETRLIHASGQSVGTEYPISGATDQAIGSSLTYGRRYSLSTLVGLAGDEDDDAETSTAAAADPPWTPPAAKPASEPGARAKSALPRCPKLHPADRVMKSKTTEGYYCHDCKSGFLPPGPVIVPTPPAANPDDPFDAI